MGIADSPSLFACEGMKMKERGEEREGEGGRGEVKGGAR